MIELNCPACGKLLQIEDRYRGTTGRCNGCGGPVYVPADALTSAQRAMVAANPTSTVEVMETDWQDDPASHKQLSYLAKLGATPSMLRGLTKGRASDMIEELEDVRHATVYHNQVSVNTSGNQGEVAAAIQRQTNFHKNACGCLILILLAPFWVPAFTAIFASILVGIGAQSVSDYDHERPSHSEADYVPNQQTPSTTVYAPASGAYYHRVDCRRLDGEAKESMTMATADATGMKPCGICQPNIP